MVEVDREDPGFKNPTKFIGPVYPEAEAKRLESEKGWVMKQDGDKWRRVVASPLPKRIFEMRPIKWLLEKGAVVIAAGGGGIPTVYEPGRKLRGIEAVIDKDLCSELLALARHRTVQADLGLLRANWGRYPMDDIARGIAMASVILQSSLRSLVANGAMTRVQALNVIEGIGGTVSSREEEDAALVTVETLQRVREGLADVVN
jgi:hypothetical protein